MQACSGHMLAALCNRQDLTFEEGRFGMWCLKNLPQLLPTLFSDQINHTKTFKDVLDVFSTQRNLYMLIEYAYGSQLSVHSHS